MKTRITAVVTALSFAATVACFAANPQMGTWKLNEGKSKIAPGMGKSMTVIYSEQGDKIKVTVDGADKDGKPTHGGLANGTAKPIKRRGIWLGIRPPTKW